MLVLGEDAGSLGLKGETLRRARADEGRVGGFGVARSVGESERIEPDKPEDGGDAEAEGSE
jgi:hypothetical protein